MHIAFQVADGDMRLDFFVRSAVDECKQDVDLNCIPRQEK